MFKARTRSFRKNMAILVCATLILLAIPEATHAATKTSSRTSDYLKDSSPLISAVFSFLFQNLSPFGYDLTLSYSPSTYSLIVLDKENEDPRSSRNNKSSKDNDQGYTNSTGNSTSQKKPEDKDK